MNIPIRLFLLVPNNLPIRVSTHSLMFFRADVPHQRPLSIPTAYTAYQSNLRLPNTTILKVENLRLDGGNEKESTIPSHPIPSHYIQTCRRHLHTTNHLHPQRIRYSTRYAHAPSNQFVLIRSAPLTLHHAKKKQKQVFPTP